MSPQLLEAIIVLAGGGLAVASAIWSTPTLRYVSGCAGIAVVLVGLILGFHAGL